MYGEILIIDDRIKLCKSLAKNFDQLGYKTFYATNSKDAIRIFSKQNINTVLLDIMLGEENGIDILKKLVLLNKNTPVIMITGYASIDSAVESIKFGAFDYIKKPLDFNKLLKIVENAIKMSILREENLHLKDRLIELAPRIITQNKSMIELCSRVKRLASTELPILICGESGTGKELIAELIHSNSNRNSRKMLKINCASFPESLLDNELFGHEKGAYTGADFVFKGVFEKADKSSLFLDEIGDMSLTIQAKILRTLQNHEIRRLGGNNTIMVDVRFITATNKDLKELINKNKFREDLYYRLNTAIICIPPLRERKEDIPLLIEYFLHESVNTSSKNIITFTEALLEKLTNYHWPGNVRELYNTVNYASAITLKDYIDIDDLPPTFIEFEHESKSENIREEMEKQLILKTLQKLSYNKKKTAELLKMSRKTLYNKLEKYGIST